MKSYWENYAKAVDPLNYKRKMESQTEESHAESTADKIEEQMTTINEKINNLKSSIKKSNEAAQAKADIVRPKEPLMPKNEESKDQGSEASLEQRIVKDNQENPTASPNENQIDLSNSGGSTSNQETNNVENNKGVEAAGKNEETTKKNEETENKNEETKENSVEKEKKQEESSKTDENKGAEQEKAAEQANQEENKGETMRFLQNRPKQESLNGPLQSGFTIYKELYDK